VTLWDHVTSHDIICTCGHVTMWDHVTSHLWSCDPCGIMWHHSVLYGCQLMQWAALFNINSTSTQWDPAGCPIVHISPPQCTGCSVLVFQYKLMNS